MNKNYHKELLDKMNIAVVVLNTKNEVKYANLMAEELFGAMVYDKFNLHLTDMQGDELSGENNPVRKVTVNKIKMENLVLTVKNHQGIRKIFANITPDFDEKGEIKEILATFRDITAELNLAESLEQAASTIDSSIKDPMTGLFNNEYCLDYLAKETAGAGRYMHDLTIMVIDIDNFKNLNAGYGRKTGDDVLKKVGEKICEVARESDTVGRYAGEEFLVILPKANIDNSVIVAERIRLKIERSMFTEERLKLTVSIGVAQLGNGETCAELLNNAEIKLAKAKEKGNIIAY